MTRKLQISTNLEESEIKAVQPKSHREQSEANHSNPEDV
jgi:hypothetical protein